MKSLTTYLQTKQQLGKDLFIPYIMAGANGLENLAAEITMLAEVGATAIEIGIPFSDPVADGPIIQKAGIQARKNGVTLKKIIQQLQVIDAPVPLILMGYANVFYQYGFEQLPPDLAGTSVAGLIIPDLPYEHQLLLPKELLDADLALVRLVSLTSDTQRMNQLISDAEGFLYAVTVNGTTGITQQYGTDLDRHLQNLTKKSQLPVLAGFGISESQDIDRFIEDCDGIIIGSKIVHQLATDGLAGTRTMLEGLFSASKLRL